MALGEKINRRGGVFCISQTAVIGIILLAASGPAMAKNWKKSNPFADEQLTIEPLTDLHFGTIAPDQQLTGTVRVKPNRNGFSQCDRVLTCLEDGTRGEFRISGDHQRFAHLDLPLSATLQNSGGHQMTIDRFKMHAPGFIQGRGKLKKNGYVIIGVGADLHVGAQQPMGRYSGTFQVTLSYE